MYIRFKALMFTLQNLFEGNLKPPNSFWSCYAIACIILNDKWENETEIPRHEHDVDSVFEDDYL